MAAIDRNTGDLVRGGVAKLAMGMPDVVFKPDYCGLIEPPKTPPAVYLLEFNVPVADDALWDAALYGLAAIKVEGTADEGAVGRSGQVREVLRQVYPGKRSIELVLTLELARGRHMAGKSQAAIDMVGIELADGQIAVTGAEVPGHQHVALGGVRHPPLAIEIVGDVGDGPAFVSG